MKHFLLCIYFVVSGIAAWAVAPITGNFSVCLGGSRHLSDTSAGGLWLSSNLAVATIDASGTVLGASLGTSEISYVTGSGFASVVVTVVAPPANVNVTGGGTCCENGPGVSIGVDSSETGVLYYVYKVTPSGGGTPISGGYSGTGHALALDAPYVAGTYFVIASTGLTHCALQMAGYVNISVNPVPAAIGGKAKVCPGDTVHLGDADAGGRWISRSPAIAVVDSITGVVRGVAGGTDMISYQFPTGCFTTKIVTVDPIPLPTVTFDASTQTLYAPTGYAGYQWCDSINGVIVGATARSIAATFEEYYYVQVTSGSGCRIASPYYYYLSETKAGELGAQDICPDAVLYPNPAWDVITFKCNEQIQNVVICDLQGHVVLAQEGSSCLDISCLSRGYYVAILNATYTVRFRKE